MIGNPLQSPPLRVRQVTSSHRAQVRAFDRYSGPKSRCVKLPLSPVLVKRLVVPVTARLLAGTPMIAPKALPVLFWQCSRWQIPMNIGSAAEEYVTLPQRRLPSIYDIETSLGLFWRQLVATSSRNPEPNAASYKLRLEWRQ